MPDFQKQDEQSMLRKHDERVQQNKALRQSLLQDFKNLSEAADKVQEEAKKLQKSVQEEGKALDKMIEKQEAAFAEDAGWNKKMDDRVSRVETGLALALTAMVVNEKARSDPFDSGLPSKQ
ncbi:MAG: hypothetical protein SGARI_000853 [Bacillariaceae sp.]